MNSELSNWLVVLATVVVWASLLWWTVRITTGTRTGLILKSLAVCLLLALGGVMLWNTYIVYGRPN